MDKPDYVISTTIKKIWMDKILSGEKYIEYKADKPFWGKRLNRASQVIHNQQRVDINFLCGQKSYKYNVTFINYRIGLMNIDGVECNSWYEIHLGERIV